MDVPTIELPNKTKIPVVGFGTWQVTDEKELELAINNALEAGYRLIDCAAIYGNEKLIGRVLKNWLDSGKIKRNELYIVTKLPPVGNRSSSVAKYLEKSLKDLQLEYVDLYLINAPFGFQESGDDLWPKNDDGTIKVDMSTNLLEVWEAMEEQVVKGKARGIGLSNFKIDQIKRILDNTNTPVSMLQVELHLYFQQSELVKFCESKGIPITAYSPLGNRGLVKLLNKGDILPDLLEDPVLQEISRKHSKTPAQVALKFIVTLGFIVIPKSVTPKRITENIELFGWNLDEEDISNLKNIDKGPSARICNFTFITGIEKHPEFPF